MVVGKEKKPAPEREGKKVSDEKERRRGESGREVAFL